jgi:hypothetical protein
MTIPVIERPNTSNAKAVLRPKHPERVCWGCDKYCPAEDLRCGNGTIRTQHPVELFGDDWLESELNGEATNANKAQPGDKCESTVNE